MRLLIARAGALGDLLLLRRVLHAARRGGHEVTLLAPEPGAFLAGDGPAQAARHIGWGAPELAALLGGTPVPHGPWRAALEACDLALAYTRQADVVHGLARLIPLTMAFDPRPGSDSGPAAAWLARPLRAVGLDADGDVPAHAPSQCDRDSARPWLERLPAGFLALHPGSGSRSKNWPFERFLALADELSPAEPWLLALGPAEAALCTDRPTPERAVIARDLPLGTLAALFGQAGLYVGNDSGATHLAAACGAPTLALFGPTDPQVWAPEGAHVTALRAPGGDLAALDAAEVAAAARGRT